MIKRSEYDNIVMVHTNTNNITLMVRGKVVTFTKEQEEESSSRS